MSTLRELPNFTRLSDRVIRILGLNPGSFTLQGTNTYLIGTGARRILLDTGEGRPDYFGLLSDSLHKAGDGVTISDVLITHWHKDHVGGIAQVHSLAHAQQWSPAPRIHKMLDPEHDDPAIVWEPVQDGQVFSVVGTTLRALATPGHTPDHLAFILEEENAIFSGDCVLGHGTTVFSDLATYMSSLQRMQQLKPAKIYPGHGPVVENALDWINDYMGHRLEREQQFVDVLRDAAGPVTALEIVHVVYKDYPENLWPAAEKGALLHLNKLEGEGRVVKISEDSGVTKWQIVQFSSNM